MPALPPFATLDVLVGRTVANTTNQLGPQIQNVSCSWPISGEYGVGSRILYYVLVAACVLARKSEWLRNACLAAALIFPATAAIHAIVIASLHVDGAIDLDVYGAFQLCTIGILTAPATVRLSKTYFNNPGRNVLFVWTMLVLAGLLALAVEFFRAHSVPCTDDGSGRPLYYGTLFPYDNTTCGLVCSVEKGPYSPMRDGAADNIYVIPTPNVLSFGAATLVAAACCIPGVLSMVSTYQKILKTNWAKQSGGPDANEVIEGTNGATVGGMKTVNDLIRRLLSVVEVPVFGAAVLALIIVGELNFWSEPVNFQTEPIANVSQWSSIGASVLAACGSLYMLLAKHLDKAEQEETAVYPPGPCNCLCHEHDSSRADSLSDNPEMEEIARPPPSTTTADTDLQIYRRDTSPTHILAPIRTDTYPDSEDAARGLGIHTIDSNSSATGNRHEVTKALMRIATAFGTASADRFDDHQFRQGKATGFPEIPGEGNRNSKLNQIKQQWGEPSVDNDDGLTPRGRRSRADSFNGSIYRSPSIASRAPSPQPRARAQTTGPGLSLLGLPTTHSPETTSESVFPARPSAELEQTRSQATVVTLHEGPNSPAIVLSSEDDVFDEPAEVSVAVVEAAPVVEQPTPPENPQLPEQTKD